MILLPSDSSRAAQSNLNVVDVVVNKNQHSPGELSLPKVSFVVVMELSRRAPLHGGAFQWRFTHSKAIYPNVKYFKILIIILFAYVYFGEIRRRGKKMLSTKLLCELEIMYEEKHHQTICQSFEADRCVFECSAVENVTQHFYVRHKKRFQLKCFILIASRFFE